MKSHLANGQRRQQENQPVSQWSPPPRSPPFETGKTRFQFPQRHKANVGQPAGLLCWWANGFFLFGFCNCFFWRLADTLASFFLASSTGTPSFSTCCAVLVIVLVLVPIFLIFLQQEIGHRGEIWGKCNEMGPFQARFSKAMVGWLSRVCRGHLCCRFFGGG